MKYITLFATLLISACVFAQADSANSKPSVTLQARDIEYLLNFTGFEPKYDKMDSVFVAKLSVSSPPTGTTNVTCDSVKAKHWLSIFERMRFDALGVDQGIWNRLKAALNSTSFSWLTVRITRSDDAANEAQSEMRSNGRKRARKELDEQ